MDKSLQKLFDELTEKRAQLFSELDKFQPEQLEYKSSPEMWSMLQVVNHLLISEQHIYQYLCKKNQAKTLDPAGVAAAARSLVLNAFLKSPLRVSAPRQLPLPESPRALPEMRKDWDATRRDMETFLMELPSERLQKIIFRHPFAGRFNIAQTLKFMINHIVHHIRQVRRIARSTGFPANV